LLAIKARMTLLKLLAVLVCSELLVAGQSPLERARELVAKGSLKEAEVTLRQIIAADPNSADARILLGTALVLEGVRGESVEQLTEAVRLRPNSANAHNKLGTAFSRFLEIKPAREEFEKALELDPNLAEAHVNLALILAQAGEFGPAGEHLDRAIELQGNRRAAAYAHYLRAKVWGAQNQNEKATAEFQAALAKYRAALDLDPTGFGFRLNYALALCRLGRWQDGVVELREVLRLDPDNADAKALYIAREQAIAKTGNVRKRP
jgi:tetratricopeptide (TPR) repeat protein